MISPAEKKWIVLLMRWIVGLTFLIASIHKIADPAQFAKIIYGYGLFPHDVINLIAIVLPFLELATGLLLLTGKYSISAASLAAAMMAGFTIIISINMIRGYEFDCGCFSFYTEGSMFGKKFLLIRDIILFIICILLTRTRSEKQERSPRK